MKTKFKRILSPKDIVAGQFYIRAVINCHGRTWLEVFTIHGKPVAEPNEYHHPCYGKITTKATDRHSKPRLRYIADLMSSYRDFEGGLYRFNNELYRHLQRLLSNRRALMEFFNQGPLSDSQVKSAVENWEQMIYYDSQTCNGNDGEAGVTDPYERYMQDLRNDATVSKFVFQG